MENMNSMDNYIKSDECTLDQAIEILDKVTKAFNILDERYHKEQNKETKYHDAYVYYLTRSKMLEDFIKLNDLTDDFEKWEYKMAMGRTPESEEDLIDYQEAQKDHENSLERKLK